MITYLHESMYSVMKVILPALSYECYNLKPCLLYLKFILGNYYYIYYKIILIMTSLLPDEEIELLLNEFDNSGKECNINVDSGAENSMSDVLHNINYGNYWPI